MQMTEMEDVRQNILQTIVLTDETMQKLLEKLKTLGVSVVADLVEVKVEDLTPEVLLPVPARKLIRAWSSQTAVPGDATPTVCQVRTPMSVNQTANFSSPTIISTPRGDAGSSSMNWVSKVDIASYIEEMMNDRESPQQQQAARALSAHSALSNIARNEVVRFLGAKILKLCRTPSRSSLNSFSELLVTQYPQFKDVIGDTVVGTGYTSVRNQLENRLSYLKRPITSSRKSAAVKRRLESKGEGDTPMRKTLRDGYGCVDFLPISIPDGETTESLTEKQKALKQLHANSSNNETEISALMAATYHLQRQDLVGHLPLTAPEISDEWPYLVKPKWMIQHLSRLLGINVLERLSQGLSAKKQSLLNYFQTQASSMKELGRRFTATDFASESPAALLPLLMVYFGEDEAVLFCQSEVNKTLVCFLPLVTKQFFSLYLYFTLIVY